MKKVIKSISIDGNPIRFTKALLEVGRNNGITYILKINDPVGLPRAFQNTDIDITTEEGETRLISGTLDFASKDKANVCVSGEPFPVTEEEYRKFS